MQIMQNLTEDQRTALAIFLSFVMAGLLSTAVGQSCEVKTTEGLEARCEREEVEIDRHPSDPIEISTVALRLAADSDGSAIAFEIIIARENAPALPSPESVVAEIGDETYELGLVNGETKFKDGHRLEEKFLVVNKELSIRIGEARNFRVQIGEAVLDLSPATDQMYSVIREIGSRDI